MVQLNPFSKSKLQKKYDEMEQYFIHDEYKDALEIGRELHKRHPDHLPTMLLIAEIHLKHNHHDKAEERYSKIIDKEPYHTEARMGRAESYFFQDEYELALADYLTLYESSFNTTRYLVALGNCYQKLELHTIATRYYEKAVKQAPKDIDALIAYSYHLILTGQRNDAEEVAVKAKKIYYDDKLSFEKSHLEAIEELEKEVKQLMMPNNASTKKNTKKKK